MRGIGTWNLIHLFSIKIHPHPPYSIGMNDITRCETVQVQIYDDASGAPATVTYGRYTFAFDTLGEVKCTLIKPVYGTRVENKIALDMCTKAYMSARKVSAEWLARNAEMYKGEQ